MNTPNKNISRKEIHYEFPFGNQLNGRDVAKLQTIADKTGDPFIVTSITQNYSKEFNSRYNCKFYMFKFHKTFDGLIGSNNFRLVEVRLDFGKFKFTIQNSTSLYRN